MSHSTHGTGKLLENTNITYHYSFIIIFENNVTTEVWTHRILFQFFRIFLFSYRKYNVRFCDRLIVIQLTCFKNGIRIGKILAKGRSGSRDTSSTNVEWFFSKPPNIERPVQVGLTYLKYLQGGGSGATAPSVRRISQCISTDSSIVREFRPRQDHNLHILAALQIQF